MKSVTTHEAKTRLSSLLRDVERGEEVTIRLGQTPVAKLVGVDRTATPKRPPVGTITSRGVRYEPEAFEPLDGGAMEQLGLV